MYFKTLYLKIWNNYSPLSVIISESFEFVRFRLPLLLCSRNRLRYVRWWWSRCCCVGDSAVICMAGWRGWSRWWKISSGLDVSWSWWRGINLLLLCSIAVSHRWWSIATFTSASVTRQEASFTSASVTRPSIARFNSAWIRIGIFFTDLLIDRKNASNGSSSFPLASKYCLNNFCDRGSVLFPVVWFDNAESERELSPTSDVCDCIIEMSSVSTSKLLSEQSRFDVCDLSCSVALKILTPSQI